MITIMLAQNYNLIFLLAQVSEEVQLRAGDLVCPPVSVSGGSKLAFILQHIERQFDNQWNETSRTYHSFLCFYEFNVEKEALVYR